VRRTVPGKDGGGEEWGFKYGYLKGIFTVFGDRTWDAGAGLLEKVEQFCAAAGKQNMFVTVYSGPYFWPGIDVRYDRIYDLLNRHGYRDVRTMEDVAVNLQDPIVTKMYDRVCASLPADAVVKQWEPSLLPPMRKFVEEGKTPYWFPPHWEKGLSVPRENVFILQQGEEILGWAQYSPGAPRAGFGPILVLPRVRGNNYGARLLLECMVRSRDAGTTRMTAGWANTGFYTRHGWHVARRYALLTKELSK